MFLCFIKLAKGGSGAAFLTDQGKEMLDEWGRDADTALESAVTEQEKIIKEGREPPRFHEIFRSCRGEYVFFLIQQLKILL